MGNYKDNEETNVMLKVMVNKIEKGIFKKKKIYVDLVYINYYTGLME